jgi:hypothetical protein
LDEQLSQEALAQAMANFGPRVLSNVTILNNVMIDLLPDNSRERSLIVAAAEADVATRLQNQVSAQQMDPDNAVRLTAQMLAEAKSIDPAAALWVTYLYSTALGQAPTRSALIPPPTPAPMPQAPLPPQAPMPPGGGPEAAGGIHTAPTMVPTGPSPFGSPQSPQYPAGSGYGYGQPGGGGYGPPPGGPGYGGPPGGVPPVTIGAGYPQPQPKRGMSGAAIGGIVAGGLVLVLLLCVGVAAVAGLPPFDHPKPKVSTSASPSGHFSPTPTAPSILTLLPHGVADPVQDCQTGNIPSSYNTVGLLDERTCTDPSLPASGYVRILQFDSGADYETSWRNFNDSVQFDPSTEGDTCPPPSGKDSGSTVWHNDSLNLPNRSGQVLECYTSNSVGPIYAWTLPGYNLFYVAAAGSNGTFTALDDWWTNGSPPNGPLPPPPANHA